MMRLPKFEYHAPKTLSEALRIMTDSGPDSMFVAGGTDLYPNMKRRQQTPHTVISVMRIRELRECSVDAEGLRIGPGVTLTALSTHPAITANWPVIASAAKLISTPLLRNMGTIGGNLLLDTRCNYYDQNYEWRRGINFCMKKDGHICWVAPSSPKCWAVQSSDLAPVMVAIGAKLLLLSSAGERWVDAAELYNNDGINYLHKRPDELLTEIRVPQPGRWRAVYKKLRRRGAFDFPVLGVAAAVEGEKDGVVSQARIVLGGVAPAPIQVRDVESALVGSSFGDKQIDAAVEACYQKARPLDNTDFSMTWRKQMVRPYVERALKELSQVTAPNDHLP
ncbi:MAG TPA: xanthine dehydrogenase family protein subunit M [Blastocatellia bacterium]